MAAQAFFYALWVSENSSSRQLGEYGSAPVRYL
jgi:hypothetical protein